jgi:hypothetical protein
VKIRPAANDNLIDRTIAVWQPRSRRKLNREDARQIVENISGFFRVLSDWSRAEISANDNRDQRDAEEDRRDR